MTRGLSRDAICLIGGSDDVDLVWLATELRARAMIIDVVLAEELVSCAELTYRIDDLKESSVLRLQDGRVVTSRDCPMIINRMTTPPIVPGARNVADALYLEEEWRAVLAAWLRTFRCPVLNPPRAGSLCGATLPRSAWLASARRLGLPTVAWDNNAGAAPPRATLDVLCLGSRCIDPTGELPASARHALTRLCRYAGAPLLSAEFELWHGGWLFSGASPTPCLEPFGSAVVETIVECACRGQVD